MSPSLPSPLGPKLLSEAISAKDLGKVRALLDAGADPCAKHEDSPMLEYALDSKSPEIVKMLLLEGADPNVCGHGNKGRPMLHIAIVIRQLGLAKLLLEYGADPDKIDRTGRSPLLFAAYTEEKFLPLLLRAGADPNLPLQNNFSPLHAAAFMGRVSNCLPLIEYGADPALVCSNGFNPLEVAEEALAKHKNAAELLAPLRVAIQNRALRQTAPGSALPRPRL